MVLRAFIFDLDGVLIDSKDAHAYSYAETAKKYGLELDIGKLNDIFRTSPGKNTMRKLYPDLSEETVSRLSLTQRDFLASQKSVAKVSLVRDALELAYSLHNRALPTAIVTNSTEAFVSEVFHRLSMPEIFDYILPKKDDAGSKEQRFEYVLDRWQIPREHVLYIGDAVSDVEVARKLGTKVAIIYNKASWAWPVKTPLLEAQPDYILENAKQVLEIVPFI